MLYLIALNVFLVVLLFTVFTWYLLDPFNIVYLLFLAFKVVFNNVKSHLRRKAG